MTATELDPSWLTTWTEALSMLNSSNTKSEGLLPCASVRSPIEAGVLSGANSARVVIIVPIVVLVVLSAAEEARAIHAVIVSGIR